MQGQVNILTLHFHPQLKGVMERGERGERGERRGERERREKERKREEREEREGEKERGERGERSCICHCSTPAGPSESCCGRLIDSLTSHSNYKQVTCLYFGSSVHICSNSMSSLASWRTCGMLRSASGFKFIFSFAVADTGINTGEKHTQKHT